MRKWLSAFTLIELLVVIAIIAILAGLLLPALARAREESRRKACNSNLGQISKACITYQEPNGDFFPVQDQVGYKQATSEWKSGESNDYYVDPPGGKARILPMPSLATLYPTYLDNPKVFVCPSTSDKALLAMAFIGGAKHITFGDPAVLEGVPGTQPGLDPKDIGSTGDTDDIDPATYSGTEVGLDTKCSYLYDEFTHFRDVGPGQAIAADADGQTWKTPTGGVPPYPDSTNTIGGQGNLGVDVNGADRQLGLVAGLSTTWLRYPKKSNHDGGQNLMFFDGHIRWATRSYESDDPKDNVFCPNGGSRAFLATLWDDRWGSDTDAYLWDGVNGRTIQPAD
jgi:prepilin-type N-terminal cleavage/methylation domain-containing protein